MTDMINVGERRIDAQHRVLLGKTVCEAHDRSPGDMVEIWVRKIKEE